MVLRSEAGMAGREPWCPELIRFLTETTGSPDEATVL